MAVDPRKKRKILVVHGVQTGSSARLNQHLLIRDLLNARKGDLPLRFQTEMYRYEDSNDDAQKRLQQLLSLLARSPVGAKVAASVLDLIGDVVTSLLDTSTAAEIRRGLRERILKIFEAGNPCYVVAHSLGSIYAFDVVNELMAEEAFFDRGSRRTWPVQSLLTLGSPIGLGMFRKGRGAVRDLGPGSKWFRWVNYFDLTDPVVSGDLFGRQLQGFRLAERYLRNDDNQGWLIRDRPVDTGKLWLLAHTAYWTNPVVGDGLLDTLAN